MENENKISIRIEITATGEVRDGRAETEVNVHCKVHAPHIAFVDTLVTAVLNLCHRNGLDPQLFALALTAKARRQEESECQ